MTPAHPQRRLGAPESQTRARLLDAATQLLVGEGYAAVTSRRVAAAAGLKPQLVHYYFATMDDLFVELFRRQAEANLGAFERVLAAEPVTLERLWRINADPAGASLTLEFVALANHRKAIRTEIARYAERFRAAQLEAVGTALAGAGIGVEQLPPVVALLLITGLTQVMAIEQALGVTSGHDETIAYVEEALGRLEAHPRRDRAGA